MCGYLVSILMGRTVWQLLPDRFLATFLNQDMTVIEIDTYRVAKNSHYTSILGRSHKELLAALISKATRQQLCQSGLKIPRPETGNKNLLL
jgi:hypothetical protein